MDSNHLSSCANAESITGSLETRTPEGAPALGFSQLAPCRLILKQHLTSRLLFAHDILTCDMSYVKHQCLKFDLNEYSLVYETSWITNPTFRLIIMQRFYLTSMIRLVALLAVKNTANTST